MQNKKHLYIAVDDEASGPVPGLYDIISIGLVVMSPTLNQTFYGEFAPLHDDYVEAAYRSIGMTREQHLAMPDAHETTLRMVEWLDGLGADRLTLVSDNPSFDAAFPNWLCHKFVGRSPFGHSGRRIGDFAAGLERNFRATNAWKRLRKTKHSHNALDDAMGNAEALNALFSRNGLRAPWM